MNQTDFLIFALGIGGIIHFLNEPVCDWLANRKYQKERNRFYNEITAGRTPERCPVLVTYRGASKIDPNDLVQTAGFKRRLSGFSKIAKAHNL